MTDADRVAIAAAERDARAEEALQAFEAAEAEAARAIGELMAMIGMMVKARPQATKWLLQLQAGMSYHQIGKAEGLTHVAILKAVRKLVREYPEAAPMLTNATGARRRGEMPLAASVENNHHGEDTDESNEGAAEHAP
jgi:hypothetical protein